MSEESKNNKKSENSKGFVLPGDLLETKSKPGKGIFRKDGRVYSSVCLLYTSPSPRDATLSRMPSSA